MGSEAVRGDCEARGDLESKPPQFKQLLNTLNKRRLIILEGVDLPGIWVNNGRTARDRAASQRLVQESEIESLGSPFHFILV